MSLKQSFINNLPGAYEAITSITGVTPKGRAQGVDVSHWQGWFRPETSKNRIDFAIQKLTEGTTFVDPKINEIWSGVKQVEMRGGYHYQRSGVSWSLQAGRFLETASKYDHHMYILDVEKINNLVIVNYRPNYSFFADMFRIVNHWREQAPSKKVVLYSNWDLFNNVIYPAIKHLYGDLGVKWLTEEIDVWYAQYWNTPSVDKDPSLPTWMKTWRLWQIADKYFHGPDWGVQSLGIDVNVYNGTPDEMRSWLGLSTPAPEPDPEPEPPPIVVEPPMRPEITPEPRLWAAEVVLLRTMLVRSYPIRADDTTIPDGTGSTVKIYGGEMFKGKIWSGNNYVWMRIEEYPSRPTLIGKWVAVRTTNGLEKFITLRATNTSITTPHLWQVLHDAQLGEIRKPTEGRGAPEVFPMMDKHFTRFTKDWQMFSFELMALPANKWRAVFTHERAITNDNGFDRPGDPRADYVNKRDLGSPDPKYASLLFGGNVITGTVDGDYLLVQTLNGNVPPPPVSWVRERPWLTQVFTNVYYDTGRVGNFPQGDGLPVIGPILASQPVRFPLKNLKKLPLGSPIPKVYWP